MDCEIVMGPVMSGRSMLIPRNESRWRDSSRNLGL